MQLEERDPLGWVMKALREAGSSITSELAYIDDRASTQRPAEDELCLKEIAAHLRDAHPSFRQRRGGRRDAAHPDRTRLLAVGGHACLLGQRRRRRAGERDQPDPEPCPASYRHAVPV